MEKISERQESVSLDTPLKALLNKLDIIEGCGARIDRETKNTPDARHKGRTVVRETGEVRQLLAEVLKEHTA